MRLPVLVLVLAVIVILPSPAQGAVSEVSGVPGCTVHSSIDAFAARGTGWLGVYPADGSDWNWGVEYDTAPTEEHIAMSKEVYRLAEQVGTELFTDVRILVLPTSDFIVKNSNDPDQKWAGLAHIKRSCNEVDIFVGGLNPDLLRNFRHEVGHLAALHVLDAPGEDWSGANKLGQMYLKLRNYPSHLPLDYQIQLELAWEDRAAEWFAEDFAWWATPAEGRDEFEYLASAKEPNTVLGLEKYFDLVFHSGGELPCNCTEISAAVRYWKAPWSSPYLWLSSWPLSTWPSC